MPLFSYKAKNTDGKNVSDDSLPLSSILRQGAPYPDNLVIRMGAYDHYSLFFLHAADSCFSLYIYFAGSFILA